MKNCKQCNEEFEAKRADALFCGPKCQKAHKRAEQGKSEATAGRLVDELGQKDSKLPLISDKTSEIIKSDTSEVMTPEGLKAEVPANYGLANCECQQCQGPAVKSGQLKLNHGLYKKADELQEGEMNRVNLPGDVDYEAHVMDVQEVT